MMSDTAVRDIVDNYQREMQDMADRTGITTSIGIAGAEPVVVAAPRTKTDFWTQDMYVHARVEINGVDFKVVKCDTKGATLEPSIAWENAVVEGVEY